MTHEAREADLQGALRQIEELDGVVSVRQMLRVAS